jgi:hypothetical protein
MRPIPLSEAQMALHGSSGLLPSSSGQQMQAITSAGLVPMALGPGSESACYTGAMYSVDQLSRVHLGLPTQYQVPFVGPGAGAPLMGLPSSSGQLRQEQGYRGLWQACAPIQTADSRAASAASVAGHGVPSTVEEMVAVLRSLPQGASAVPAISAGLSYLDSR